MRGERLVVLTGPLKGKVCEIGDSLSIGRNPENDIQLDDLQVSRKHAELVHDARGTILRDLGSGNGTYIGNRRILEYKLSNGDVIRIGTQELRYEGVGVMPAADADKSKSAAQPDSGVRFEAEEGKNVNAEDASRVFQTFFAAPKESATENELRETQKRLQAVYTANQIITSEQNLSKLFERVMDQIFALVPAHNGVILLRQKMTGELVPEYIKPGLADTEVTVSSSIVSRAFDKGEAVITYDAAEDSRFGMGASIISQNITSAMCVPLTHQDERLGVIYVDTRGAVNAFVAGDLELLVAVAGPAAVAIRNAQYVQAIEQGYQDTLIVLANAVEMRDHYTVGHTWRVTNFTIEIAKELGWPDEKLVEVQRGGVLHDVGKIAVEDAILRKPDRLTDEEFAKIKVHPEKGAQLLQDVEFLRPLIPYALYHHERFDGRGYPYGLKGEEIPIEGRALAVGDTFDALTSNRPYRKGMDPDVAIAEIERCKGTQFDPECADALIRAYKGGKIHRILQDYHKKDGRSIACPFCSTHIRLPEGANVGDTFGCDVCHRIVRLCEQNEAYYGELVPQSSIGVLHRTTPPSTPKHGTPSG